MDLMDLDRGNPLGPPPASALAAARAALNTGCSAYTPPLGLPELRRAAAATLEAQLCRTFHPEREVMVTHGASAGLLACIQALTTPGQDVWVPDPGWPGFRAAVGAAGCRAVPWSPTVPLTAAPRPTPRLLLLATPDNPTGRLLDPAILGWLEAAVQADPQLIVVADETYRDLVYDDDAALSPGAVTALAPRTVLLRSFSKSHAMAGWRVGYLAAPAPLAQRIVPLLTAAHGGASTMAQHAARWILQHGAEDTAALRRRRQARRDRLARGLQGITGLTLPPCHGGLYLFPHVGGSSQACAEAIRSQAGVQVAPGVRFGPAGEGHIRLCFDRPDALLDAALTRMIPVLDAWERA